MGAVQEIKDAQQDWARSRGIPIDSRGYVREVEANLWRPLSTRARHGFERGAGSELKKNMRALHSSSALVVNFFDYWTDRDKIPILTALSINPQGGVSLAFEERFFAELFTPPHLDIAITHGTGVVAVESKFTEHLNRSITKGKSEFTDSYFPKSCGLWAQKSLFACQALADELWDEELCGSNQQFEYLDPRQLLKHALGLATQLGHKFSLYYLYYDWPGNRSEEHKRETDLFTERVGAEVRFKSLTYQDVFERLKDFGQVDSEYLDYLETRYFARNV